TAIISAAFPAADGAGRRSRDPPDDQQRIPGRQLSEQRDAEYEFAPSRIITRQRLDELHVGPAPYVVKNRPDMQPEKVLANNVLWRPVMAPDKSAGSVIGAEQVPRREVMSAPGREPVRERHVDKAAGAGDPDHFVDQPQRIRN